MTSQAAQAAREVESTGLGTLARCFAVAALVALSGVTAQAWSAPGPANAVLVMTGLALAAVYEFGWPAALGVAAGAFASRAVLGIDQHELAHASSLIEAAVFGASIACGALAGALFVRRALGTELLLDGARQIALFSLFGGLLSSLLAPSLDAGVLLALGHSSAEEALAGWLSWYGAAAAGVALISPVVLTLLLSSPVWRRRRLSAGIPILFAAGALSTDSSARARVAALSVATLACALWLVLSGRAVRTECELSAHARALEERNASLRQLLNERAEMQYQLAFSELRWQFVLDATGFGLWEWDVLAKRVQFSPRWQELLGYVDHELGDDPSEWASRVHPDDLGPALAAVRAQLKAETTSYASEHRMRAKDGTWKWLLAHGVVVERDERGRALKMLGMHADITERKLAEQELRQHRERLSELVMARTAALQQAKLAAEQANHAKTEFLTNMSHELRTPLHAILGLSRLGATHSADAKARDYFTKIGASAGRLLTEISALLDSATLESGTLPLQTARRNLGEGVAEILDEMQSLFAAKQLEVRVADLRSTFVVVDRARLGSVLRNVFGNAIKYSPPGGTLRVGARPALLGDLAAIELLVSDEGPGIPSEELESIFARFVQSSLTLRGGGGSGLGLAICREIMHSFDGRIHALSNAERGATFVLTFPTVESYLELQVRKGVA